MIGDGATTSGIESSMPAKFYVEFPSEQTLSALRESVRNLNNTDLLGNFIELSSGDDYDGALTDMGQRVYSMLDEEMENRLNAIGWFD